MINGYPLGHITFVLGVDRAGRARVSDHAFAESVVKRQLARFVLEGQGTGALRYRTVFLSYADEDEGDVMHIAEGLALGGVMRVMTHRTDLVPAGRSWNDLVGELIPLCDSVLLCWSSNAADKSGLGTPAIQFEIACALEQEKKRSDFRLIPMMVGHEDVSDVPLPASISDRTSQSRYHPVRRSRQRR
jgi:hypothetical protein